MLRLQKKAHASLSEYQAGLSSHLRRRGSGSTSEHQTPVPEDDELTTLGGKTRLAKTEPVVTPPLRLSPASQSPVVPLPLSPINEPQIHPNIIEYLRTFVHTPDPEYTARPSSTHQFPDASMYRPAGSFASDASLFQQPQQQSQSCSGQTVCFDTTPFPEYFPVYDYGSTDSNALMQMDVTMNGPMISPMQGRNSHTPETNMQTTWNEFVTGLGMAS